MKIDYQKKKYIYLFITALISGFFLYITFRNTDLDSLLSLTLEITPYNLFIIFLSYSLFIIFKGVRWFYMLRTIQKVRFINALGNIVIGEIGSLILPFRLGDILRWHLIAKQEHIPYMTVFTLMALERIFDIFTLLGIFLIGAKYASMDIGVIPSIWISRITNIGISLFIIFIILLFIVLRYEDYFKVLLNRIFNIFKGGIKEKLHHHFEVGLKSLHMLKNYKQVFSLIVLSIMVWTTSFFIYFTVGFLFNIQEKLFVFESMFLNGLLMFAMFIPATPGNIGTYEFFAKTALSLININDTISTGYIIVIRLISTVYFFLLALIFYMKDSVLIKQYIKDREQIRKITEDSTNDL